MDDARLPAWLARGHQAMQATIPARTRKAFASLMLDAGLWSKQRLSLDSAIARVGDCINPQHGGGQTFKVSELWLWMHDSGHHALFDAMAEDLCYRTEPIPNEQRQQELLSRIDERLSSLAAEVADLQGMREQLSPRPVVAKASAPLVAVRFSQYDHEGSAF